MAGQRQTRVRGATRWAGYVAAVLFAGMVTIVQVSPAAAAPCDAPVVSPVACENTKPGNPESEWDISGAGQLRRSRASRPTSASTRARRSGSRSTPTRRRTASTSTGWATTAALGARKVATLTPSGNSNQPNCLNAAATGLDRLRQLGPVRLVDRAGRRRLGHLLRQAGPHRRDRRVQPHRLRRPRRRRRLRRCSSRPPTRPGRPTTPTAATASTPARRPAAPTR